METLAPEVIEKAEQQAEALFASNNRKRLNKVEYDLDMACSYWEIQGVYVEALTSAIPEIQSHRLYKHALAEAFRRQQYYEKKIGNLTNKRKALNHALSLPINQVEG